MKWELSTPEKTGLQLLFLRVRCFNSAYRTKRMLEIALQLLFYRNFFEVF